jgi:N6-adenosine-specific RNA methylase IME4
MTPGAILAQENKFRAIYLDPPWRFKNWSLSELAQRGEKWARRNGRSPYPVMSPDDLKKLPVGDLGSRDSLMFMWATYPKMEEAIELMAIYGYKFTTVAFTWVKLNPSGIGWHFGLGYYTRQNPEVVLLGKRGKGVKRVDNSVPNLVIWPRGEHSAKPFVVGDAIRRLLGEDVPKAELFARRQSQGFECWGNEVSLNDKFGALNDYIAPPYEAIVDEDEYNGLPPSDVIDLTSIPVFGQMRLM